VSKIAPFTDAELLREWDDGYKLVEVRTHKDLKTLSANGGGCAEHHAFLTEIAQPQCDFMFVMLHEGQVGTIMFCKNAQFRGQYHPQEAERKAWWQETYGGGMYSHLTSVYYDTFPDGLDNYVADYQLRLERAKADYQAIKVRALVQGPIGRDHPMKADLDAANKKVTACKGELDKEMARVRVSPGMHFMYRDTEVFILQITGRGTDYTGSNTRYTDKLAEFVQSGKEGAVGPA
jgi:hypothetical protein